MSRWISADALIARTAITSRASRRGPPTAHVATSIAFLIGWTIGDGADWSHCSGGRRGTVGRTRRGGLESAEEDYTAGSEGEYGAGPHRVDGGVAGVQHHLVGGSPGSVRDDDLASLGGGVQREQERSVGL